MAAKRHRVAVGETVEMVMSEARALTVGLMDKIGGEVRRVRILDGCVELLSPDDDRPWINFTPPFDYVGVHADARGDLWVDPVPRWLTRVCRYGEPVSVPMTRAVHAIRWLETYTPWSAVHALRDEGYEIDDNYFYEGELCDVR